MAVVEALRVEVEMPKERVLRVGHLPEGTCYLKEHRLWIKQETGYSLALDNFIRYQVRPTEQVERTYERVRVIAE